MSVINKRERLPALFMLFIGMATVMGSLQHSIGTLGRMGPGFFPLLLGSLLMLVALLIAVTPSDSGDAVPLGRPTLEEYRAWLLTILSVVLFIVLGKLTGLVLATFALVFVSTFADRRNSIRVALCLGSGVTLMAVLVFHYGLKMQFPLFVWG